MSLRRAIATPLLLTGLDLGRGDQVATLSTTNTSASSAATSSTTNNDGKDGNDASGQPTYLLRITEFKLKSQIRDYWNPDGSDTIQIPDDWF